MLSNNVISKFSTTKNNVKTWSVNFSFTIGRSNKKIKCCPQVVAVASIYEAAIMYKNMYNQQSLS